MRKKKIHTIKVRGFGPVSVDKKDRVVLSTELLWPPFQKEVNVKKLGAKGDGVTDDSAAISKALSLISTGQAKIIRFTRGVYKISAAVQTTITGKRNFSVIMDDNAKLINDDFSDDFIEASASFEGKEATVVTKRPHSYTSDIQIAIKGFPDLAYNGVYSIKVKDKETFTYTLVRTPAGSSTGKVRRIDIYKTFLTLSKCSSATIKLNFEGTVQGIQIQNRLGWVGLKLQNGCSDISAFLKIKGLSYGVWSGEFTLDVGNLKNSKIDVDAKDVGYPIALWKSGDNSVFNVMAENVCRAVYAGAVNNSKFFILAKNYYVTAIAITLHYIGNRVYGNSNLIVNVKDTGSDLDAPLPRICYPVAIIGYPVDGPAETKNIDISIETSNAKYATPLYIRTYSAMHKVSNINIKGLIDRSKLKDSEICNEFSIGNEDATGKGGTYSGIHFISWRVYNPPGGTSKPMVIRIDKLADNITFKDLVSNSPRSIGLPKDKRVEFPTQMIYTDNATDVVNDALLNVKYPIASYPVGTVVYYYMQSKKFRRVSPTQWSSIGVMD